jgi:hypothetical protein
VLAVLEKTFLGPDGVFAGLLGLSIRTNLIRTSLIRAGSSALLIFDGLVVINLAVDLVIVFALARIRQKLGITGLQHFVSKFIRQITDPGSP